MAEQKENALRMAREDGDMYEYFIGELEERVGTLTGIPIRNRSEAIKDAIGRNREALRKAW